MEFDLSLKSSELVGYVEMGGGARQGRWAWGGILEIRIENKQMPKQRTSPRNGRKLSLMDRRKDWKERLESNYGRT